MRRATVAAIALVACVTCLAAAVWSTSSDPEEEPMELVSQRTKNWFKPLAPIKSADHLYLYWGEGIDRHDSARVVHTNIQLDHAPQYISSFESQRWRGLSLSCCSVVVFPPFAHGFPVHGPHSNIARRIARFVAQGNTAVVTGGVTDLLFLNAYFGYHLEPVDSNYAPGPFVRRYDRVPAAFSKANIPSKLRQVDTQAVAVERGSLPFGSVILYDDMQNGTPVFILTYCMINNPKFGEPPLTVNPRSCPRWKKKGHTCGCGNIVYIGFDYKDLHEKDWNSLLRGLVRFAERPPGPPKKKNKGAKKQGVNMELAQLDNAMIMRGIKKQQSQPRIRAVLTRHIRRRGMAQTNKANNLAQKKTK